MRNIPNRLKLFVSCESIEVEFSERSHLPTTTQEPQSNVRSMTVDPASNPIPIKTWFWAVSLLPESPDTAKDYGHNRLDATTNISAYFLIYLDYQRLEFERALSYLSSR